MAILKIKGQDCIQTMNKLAKFVYMKTIFKTTVTVQHIRLRVHIRFFRQTWANAKKNFTLKSKVSKLTYCFERRKKIWSNR